MQILTSLGRYIVLLIGVVLITAYILAYAFTPIYEALFSNNAGGFGDLNLSNIALLFASLQFYIPLFFLLLGDKKRHWATGVMLLLLSLVDYQIDASRLPLFWGLMIFGCVCGVLIRWIATLILGKMPAMEKYKKYF